jgi:D-3-phosphoglycerate dehydrogenase / 2-oxoglutarate reductase
LYSHEKRVYNDLMGESLEPLILDLLEWIGPGARPYAEVLDAWRTSCPRLPVWEEANDRGFIEQHHEPGHEATVCLSTTGRQYLLKVRPSALARQLRGSD